MRLDFEEQASALAFFLKKNSENPEEYNLADYILDLLFKSYKFKFYKPQDH
jgi:hypothetical protein